MKIRTKTAGFWSQDVHYLVYPDPICGITYSGYYGDPVGTFATLQEAEDFIAAETQKKEKQFLCERLMAIFTRDELWILHDEKWKEINKHFHNETRSCPVCY